MRTIQASEMEAHFPRVLDQLERGETVAIAKQGHIVARILPEVKPKTEVSELRNDNALDEAVLKSAINRERVERAFEAFREIRKRVKPISLEEILSARDEGRM